jgi:ethanolamine utilization protein EutQ (cupin superfamily)
VATEREARLAETNFWDKILELRDQQRADRKNGVQVIKESELPLELNRQGLMRWYMHPDIKDTILSTNLFYSQEIPPGSRTGRFKFQGDQVIYVVEGRGYTLLDGVKHPWKAGDVLNLPLRKPGITVQHFNTDDTAIAKLVAVEPNFLACASVDRGSGFEQLEDAPEFTRAKRC